MASTLTAGKAACGFFLPSFDRYTDRERQLARYICLTDLLVSPLVGLVYLGLAGLNGTALLPTPPGPVVGCGWLAAVVAWLVLYQHSLVVPFPTEDTPEMFTVMRYTGRWVFLTRQTLCIQAVHAAMSMAALQPRSPDWLAAGTHAMAVPVAGLAMFVTCQYYLLVVPHPATKEGADKWHRQGVPWTLLMHWIHSPCLLLAVLDLLAIKHRATLDALSPSFGRLLGCYACYVLCYLTMLHGNYALVREWPYGVLRDLKGDPVKWCQFALKQFLVLAVFVCMAQAVAWFGPAVW